MAQRPKILIFDVETSPIRAWCWKTGEQYISHDQVVAGDRSDIICICYKWLGSPEIHSLDWGLEAQNSAKMIDEFTKVIESADIVISHNGDNFDIKHINTQRFLHGQDPISWPTSEDTLKMLRQVFHFPTYRLDYLAKLLTGSGKSPMNFQDWINIVQHKDKDALDKMIRYCKRDVAKLAKVFKRTKKYLKLKAHRGLINGDDKDSCPNCGKSESISRGLTYRAKSKVQRRKCLNCGHNFYVNKKS